MLTAQPITTSSFAPYGRVLRRPDGAPTAEGATFSYWSDLAAFRVEGETEIGLCRARAAGEPVVDWVERHDRTPEILIPADGPFLLPVQADDGAVELFRVEPGEAVVLAPGVWHGACLPAEGRAVTYYVLFRRGTPREDVTKRELAPLAVAR